MLSIVGGVYREYCMHPKWREVYGSAGRAASSIARMSDDIELHTYLDPETQPVLEMRAAIEKYTSKITEVAQGVAFYYTHPLSVPRIAKPLEQYEPMIVTRDKVLRFGMIEGDAIVKGDYVVYDPQNVKNLSNFQQNGSSAQHLALVLNSHEASVLTGLRNAPPEEMAAVAASMCNAEVVVLKRGPLGSLVYYAAEISAVPAYRTGSVWKIGSGDTFSANFAYQWMCQGASPREAAEFASRATAYYCGTQGFANLKQLEEFSLSPIAPSRRFLDGHKPLVYLAGPFFTLAQRWLIEEVRNSLRAMGMSVFSPFHDVGYGTAEDVVPNDLQGIRQADIVFAIGDGLDSGTIYEIGYARAFNKPVVLYSENESDEDKKMMQGSDCIICSDYTTAIYQTLWTAISV